MALDMGDQGNHTRREGCVLGLYVLLQKKSLALSVLKELTIHLQAGWITRKQINRMPRVFQFRVILKTNVLTDLLFSALLTCITYKSSLKINEFNNRHAELQHKLIWKSLSSSMLGICMLNLLFELSGNHYFPTFISFIGN